MIVSHNVVNICFVLLYIMLLTSLVWPQHLVVYGFMLSVDSSSKMWREFHTCFESDVVGYVLGLNHGICESYSSIE